MTKSPGVNVMSKASDGMGAPWQSARPSSLVAVTDQNPSTRVIGKSPAQNSGAEIVHRVGEQSRSRMMIDTGRLPAQLSMWSHATWLPRTKYTPSTRAELGDWLMSCGPTDPAGRRKIVAPVGPTSPDWRQGFAAGVIVTVARTSKPGHGSPTRLAVGATRTGAANGLPLAQRSRGGDRSSPQGERRDLGVGAQEQRGQPPRFSRGASPRSRT
jgi:hypothetical protein